MEDGSFYLPCQTDFMPVALTGQILVREMKHSCLALFIKQTKENTIIYSSYMQNQAIWMQEIKPAPNIK